MPAATSTPVKAVAGELRALIGVEDLFSNLASGPKIGVHFSLSGAPNDFVHRPIRSAAGKRRRLAMLFRAGPRA